MLLVHNSPHIQQYLYQMLITICNLLSIAFLGYNYPNSHPAKFSAPTTVSTLGGSIVAPTPPVLVRSWIPSPQECNLG